MATNAPKGPGRKGAVRGRSQVKNTKTNRFVKRNTKTAKFMVMDVKSDDKPFKGVRKEK
jgi:hypothetical protein